MIYYIVIFAFLLSLPPSHFAHDDAWHVHRVVCIPCRPKRIPKPHFVYPLSSPPFQSCARALVNPSLFTATLLPHCVLAKCALMSCQNPIILLAPSYFCKTRPPRPHWLAVCAAYIPPYHIHIYIHTSRLLYPSHVFVVYFTVYFTVYLLLGPLCT